MEEKLLEIISDICETEEVKINTEIDLFESHLLDSLSFIELLASIEDIFGISIPPTEVEREEFNTPKKIIKWIGKKR